MQYLRSLQVETVSSGNNIFNEDEKIPRKVIIMNQLKFIVIVNQLLSTKIEADIKTDLKENYYF